MALLPRLALIFLLIASPAAHAAPAADPAIGRWRAADGPDTASQLELTADGHFRYMLSEGALDEMAEGRWHREGALVRLHTEPRPTPPRLSLDSMSPNGEAPLTILVTGPNGSGLPGIDFRVEFDRGAPLTGYTQQYGWSTGDLEGRVPSHIQLYEPVHGILSDRVPIPPGTRTIRFTLQPNDLGIADFAGTALRVDGDRLTLDHRLGERHYARVGK